MSPTTLFTYLATGMSVQFTDDSTGIPTTWLWDFGDGEVSTEQNPLHLYIAKKVYLITLIAENAEGVDFVTHLLNLSGKPEITGTLDEFIELEAGSLFPDIAIPFWTQSKQMWQLYLQDATTPHMPDADVLIDARWPSLFRILIAKLVLYDYYLSLAKGSMLGIGSSTGGSSGTAGLKRVKTGPAEADFYNAAESYTKIFQTSPNGSSLFDSLALDVCNLGNRLRVKLPMCAALRTVGNLLIAVSRYNYCYYDPYDNPFTIDYRTSFKGYLY